MIRRAVIDDSLTALSSVYQPDVELISVRREDRNDLHVAARTVLDRGVAVNSRGVLPVDDPGAFASLLSDLDPGEALRHLLEDLRTCSALLGELVGCRSVGFRLQTLSAPMCPKFHVDRIPCRLLVTYGGPATEWITEEWLDRSAVGGTEPDNYPVVRGGSHSQLASGSISLLKGALWSASVGDAGPAYGGVVHRSPGAESGRVLLSLDPM